MIGMKVNAPKREKSYKKFTLRLPETTCDKLDAIGVREDMSRQELIERILRQVVDDKGFVLKVD